MDHARSRDGERRNEIADSEIHGPVAQGGNDVTQIGNIVYLVRNGLRRADVLVVLAVVTVVLVVIGGLLARHTSDGHDAVVGGTRPAPGQPLADADTSAWDCADSAVVPGLKIPAQGMAPLPSFPRGGIQASGNKIGIVLQGTTDEELLLTGARVEIVARHRPARGVHVVNPCGSDAPKRVFTADLDQKAPELKAIPDDTSEQTAREFRTWPYAIKRGDAEYLVLQPRSTSYDTEFRLVFSWSSGGHQGKLTVPDHGRPFRITATSAATPTCVTSRGATGYWLMPGGSTSCTGAGR
ncbi:hypothetical protein [Streptomyces sp. NPDC047000]|uniref:hypothetical protein n=1 Tax=Streptomyces sp. NPDC047000 TaxID=3155474 RepID=UPI0033CD0F35